MKLNCALKKSVVILGMQDCVMLNFVAYTHSVVLDMLD
jgi:hypothetical protein